MIALGCDHGGYDLMQAVIAYLDREGIAYKNLGCENNHDSVDYPDYGRKVVKAIFCLFLLDLRLFLTYSSRSRQVSQFL